MLTSERFLRRGGGRLIAPVGERVVRVTAECGQDFQAALRWNQPGGPALEWFADCGNGEWASALVVPVRQFLRHPRREPFRIGQQPLRPSDLLDLQGWAAHAWAWDGRALDWSGEEAESFADREVLLWARDDAAERWLLKDRGDWRW